MLACKSLVTGYSRSGRSSGVLGDSANMIKYCIAAGGCFFCAAAVVAIFAVIGLAATVVMRMMSQAVPSLFWPVVFLAGLVCGLAAGVHSFRATLRRYRTDI